LNYQIQRFPFQNPSALYKALKILETHIANSLSNFIKRKENLQASRGLLEERLVMQNFQMKVDQMGGNFDICWDIE